MRENAAAGEREITSPETAEREKQESANRFPAMKKRSSIHFAWRSMAFREVLLDAATTAYYDDDCFH